MGTVESTIVVVTVICLILTAMVGGSLKLNSLIKQKGEVD